MSDKSHNNFFLLRLRHNDPDRRGLGKSAHVAPIAKASAG